MSKATEIINGEIGTTLFRLVVPSFMALLIFTYTSDSKRTTDLLEKQAERIETVEDENDRLNVRLLEMINNFNLAMVELRASNEAQDTLLGVLGERLLDHEDRVRELERSGSSNNGSPFPGESRG